jgi:hypothetical protein
MDVGAGVNVAIAWAVADGDVEDGADDEAAPAQPTRLAPSIARATMIRKSRGSFVARNGIVPAR